MNRHADLMVAADFALDLGLDMIALALQGRAAPSPTPNGSETPHEHASVSRTASRSCRGSTAGEYLREEIIAGPSQSWSRSRRKSHCRSWHRGGSWWLITCHSYSIACGVIKRRHSQGWSA